MAKAHKKGFLLHSIWQFMKKILGMRFPWNIWIMLLIALNIGGGLYFIKHHEGIFALAAILGASIVMYGIYLKYGFVRLLGMGHILFWTPLLIWFAMTLPSNQGEIIKCYWMCSILVINGLSLLIDIADVVRYWRGDRSPL